MNGSESCSTRADGQLAFIRPCSSDGGGDCGDGAGDDGGTTTATAAMAKAAAVATTLDSCHLHCFRKSNDALKQLPRYMEICQDGNGLVGQLRTCVFLLCFFGDYFTASGNLQITCRTLWHRSGDPTSRFGVYLTYQKLNNEGATTEEETIDRAGYDRRDKVIFLCTAFVGELTGLQSTFYRQSIEDLRSTFR